MHGSSIMKSITSRRLADSKCPTFSITIKFLMFRGGHCNTKQTGSTKRVQKKKQPELHRYQSLLQSSSGLGAESQSLKKWRHRAVRVSPMPSWAPALLAPCQNCAWKKKHCPHQSPTAFGHVNALGRKRVPGKGTPQPVLLVGGQGT